MRTFVLRARKASVIADKILLQIGSSAHFEIIAHTLMNAFYFSNGMRQNVEVYIVLESSPDFPRTLKFSSNEGLSFPGFDEQAILKTLAAMLEKATVKKDQSQTLAPGIEIYGFGFDILMQKLQAERPIYLLDKKGVPARTISFEEDPVFILSDHLAMPKNSIKCLERKGLKKISFGSRMLFASQCVILVHYELDNIHAATEPRSSGSDY